MMRKRRAVDWGERERERERGREGGLPSYPSCSPFVEYGQCVALSRHPLLQCLARSYSLLELQQSRQGWRKKQIIGKKLNAALLLLSNHRYTGLYFDVYIYIYLALLSISFSLTHTLSRKCQVVCYWCATYLNMSVVFSNSMCVSERFFHLFFSLFIFTPHPLPISSILLFLFHFI